VWTLDKDTYLAARAIYSSALAARDTVDDVRFKPISGVVPEKKS
jgi:hypothetical protein